MWASVGFRAKAHAMQQTHQLNISKFSVVGRRRRILIEMKEEESRTPVSGDTRVLRKASSTDVNGNFQVVQREIGINKPFPRMRVRRFRI